MEENKQIETFWTDLEKQTKRMCWGAVRAERKHVDGMRVGYAHLHTGKNTPTSTYQGETISPDMRVWIDDVQQEALLAAVERWNELDADNPYWIRDGRAFCSAETQLRDRMATTMARAIERCQYGMMDLVKRHRVPLDLVDVPRSERRHRQIPTSEDGRVQMPESFRAPAPSGILASSVDMDMVHIDEGIRKSAPKKIAETWSDIYDNRNRVNVPGSKRTEERRKAELVEWVDTYVPGLRATNIRKELDRVDEKAGNMVAKRFKVLVPRWSGGTGNGTAAFRPPSNSGVRVTDDGVMVEGRAVWMMPLEDPRKVARDMEAARDRYYSLRNEARVERSRKLHADTVAINMSDLATGAVTVDGPGESPVASWVPEHLRCPALAVIAG